ncbi:hypothetical protein HAPAU_01830 [Halalkalicoccus paucihalophilus]|uniref:DUF4382 domain-containing protein n=1 Tax=Halalkalicoccus paucihalophilus TaxID=1008153 RepID=A0A151AIW0_9EURY|nr:hypothetical protein [Halalkalicoccus paucihalophilus]KYH27515.1 hypothetical protein HAPAU_01830 [Halalkalicoccus paucihalophilus]
MAGVLATGSIAGCLGDENEAGQLTVRNDHVLDHVVRFSIEDGPPEAYEVEQGVTADLFVGAGETKTYTDLFSTDGQYTLVAELAAGDLEQSITFAPLGGQDGDGEVLEIRLTDSYRLSYTVSPV